MDVLATWRKAQCILLLEFDKLALVRAQDHACHEARDAQLLDYFKQVDLRVQLSETFSEQPVRLDRPHDAPLLRLFATQAAEDKVAAAEAPTASLDTGQAPLAPGVAEDLS